MPSPACDSAALHCGAGREGHAGVAALLRLIVGLIAIRRQGIYFAMVTLALAQMVFFFCVQANFTGGEDGIQAVPRRPLLGIFDITDDFNFYYVVLAIFVVGFLIIYRTIHSSFGQVVFRRGIFGEIAALGSRLMRASDASTIAAPATGKAALSTQST